MTKLTLTQPNPALSSDPARRSRPTQPTAQAGSSSTAPRTAPTPILGNIWGNSPTTTPVAATSAPSVPPTTAQNIAKRRAPDIINGSIWGADQGGTRDIGGGSSPNNSTAAASTTSVPATSAPSTGHFAAANTPAKRPKQQKQRPTSHTSERRSMPAPTPAPAPQSHFQAQRAPQPRPALSSIVTNYGVGFPSNGGYLSQIEQERLKRELEYTSIHYPLAWQNLLGLYMQATQRAPFQIGCNGSHNSWRVDTLRLDILEKESNRNDIQPLWPLPVDDPDFMDLVQRISRGNGLLFEQVVAQWAPGANPYWIDEIVKRAGWTTGDNRTRDWEIIDAILKMPNGEERDDLIRQAKQERPRFFDECEMDVLFTGVQIYTKKRSKEEEDDPDYEYESQYTVRAFRQLHTDQRLESPPSAPKRRKITFDMNSGPGQPTQFHGVPLEERAFDSNGNLLPWSLEYHEEHPSARHQKRHPEEKGPFGKSTRRKNSRTRTATPARKENPTLDGFEQALKYDAKKAAELQQEANASTRQQNDGANARHAPSHTKEPTQIMLYGYPSSRQYAAIDLCEKISGGMICEDYDRQPPAEFQKYPQNFNTSRSVHSRPLTAAEKTLAFKYDGGNHWIKLTCDSAEAAARAVETSPMNIYGHWVYAELWNGKGPDSDQAIPITEDDRRQGPFSSPRPPRKNSQTLSAAFSQNAAHQQRAPSTLPRSFNPNTTSQTDLQLVQDADSTSPSTASSATATGVEYPNLRNRHHTEPEQSHEIAPGIPRYVLRPASEALLPQPTFWERQVQWLGAQGLIPTDFIGHGLPISDNGDFDWAKASWYWRLCYWLDTHVGTDICGFKED